MTGLSFRKYGLLVLFSLAFGPYGRALHPMVPVLSQPPTASFEVVDGWLKIQVTEDDKPRSGVTITCLVGTSVWAEGQTDSEGRGEFPTPKSEWCQVVFDLGAGPSAPVPLTFLKNGKVVPISSPILDGTADCCVISDVQNAETESSSLLTPEEWRILPWLLVLVAGFAAGFGYFLYVCLKSIQLKSKRKQK